MRLLPVVILLGACRTRLEQFDDDTAADLLESPSPDLMHEDRSTPADLAILADAVAGFCGKTLVGVDLQKSDVSCSLIESVTSSPGTLNFPCAGGAASAVFQADVFTGTVEQGAVALSLTKPFKWVDGCLWETHQTIAGNLADGVLHFIYEENPLPGQTGCLFACSGSADVLVK
jgi:hypothetical protein